MREEITVKTSNPISPAALALLALFSAVLDAQDPEVQEKPAHGLLPELSEREALPTGWIPLVHDPGLLSPAVRDRPHAPCSVTSPPTEGGLEDTPWPGGMVPFEFNANVSVAQSNAAIAALAVIQPLANLTFVPRAGETDFLHIRDDTRNQSSSIGYAPGQTTIRITSWNTQAVIVHEFLHALGFYHEQSRTDRGTYVTIVGANIQAGSEGNFDQAIGSFRAGPYDFGSVMHYGQCAFSICCPAGTICACALGCETILTQPAYAGFQSTMGQRVAMSPLDVHGLRSLYPQPGWRFVDDGHFAVGNGSGTNPWKELSAALANAPANARVFVMPGSYSAPGVWSNPMTLEAPVGGAVAQVP